MKPQFEERTIPPDLLDAATKVAGQNDGKHFTAMRAEDKTPMRFNRQDAAETYVLNGRQRATFLRHDNFISVWDYEVCLGLVWPQ